MFKLEPKYLEFVPFARKVMEDYYDNMIPSVIPNDIEMSIESICRSMYFHKRGMISKECSEEMINDRLKFHNQIVFEIRDIVKAALAEKDAKKPRNNNPCQIRKRNT